MRTLTSIGLSLSLALAACSETVVTDGQLLLSNGTRVTPRDMKAGS